MMIWSIRGIQGSPPPGSPLRKIHICPAGSRISAWMVMYQQDPHRMVGNRCEKNFSGFTRELFTVPLKNHFFPQKMVFRIQHHTDQQLLFFMTEPLHIILRNGFRLIKRKAFSGRSPRDPFESSPIHLIWTAFTFPTPFTD